MAVRVVVDLPRHPVPPRPPTVACTTHSGDSRGLGDIGLVTVVDEQAYGEELWRLARDLGGRTHVPDRARWILTQTSRARVVTAYTDLPDAEWTAHVRRRVVLDALFANHDVLMTGRIALAHHLRSELREPHLGTCEDRRE